MIDSWFSGIVPPLVSSEYVFQVRPGIIALPKKDCLSTWHNILLYWHLKLSYIFLNACRLQVDTSHGRRTRCFEWLDCASWDVTTSGNTLQWRHNERDGVSNQHPYDCLLNFFGMYLSNKTTHIITYMSKMMQNVFFCLLFVLLLSFVCLFFQNISQRRIILQCINGFQVSITHPQWEIHQLSIHSDNAKTEV